MQKDQTLQALNRIRAFRFETQATLIELVVARPFVGSAGASDDINVSLADCAK